MFCTNMLGHSICVKSTSEVRVVSATASASGLQVAEDGSQKEDMGCHAHFYSQGQYGHNAHTQMHVAFGYYRDECVHNLALLTGISC